MKLLLITLLAIIFLTQAQASVEDIVDTNYPASEINRLRKEVFDKTNAYRRSKGLPNFQLSLQAMRLAQQHALFLASAGWVSGQTTHYQFGARVSGYGGGSENVAYNFSGSDKVMDQWKNSSGHDKNMRGNKKYLGVGVVKTTNRRIYFVQIMVNIDKPTTTPLYSYTYNGKRYGTFANQITPYSSTTRPTTTRPPTTRPVTQRPTTRPVTQRPTTSKPSNGSCRYTSGRYAPNGHVVKTSTYIYTCTNGKWVRKSRTTTTTKKPCRFRKANYRSGQEFTSRNRKYMCYNGKVIYLPYRCKFRNRNYSVNYRLRHGRSNYSCTKYGRWQKTTVLDYEGVEVMGYDDEEEESSVLENDEEHVEEHHIEDHDDVVFLENDEGSIE